MSQECVGFGAVQDVAVGLVQPASAVLYDYYNPGEHTGDTREVWDRWQGSPAAPRDWRAERGDCALTPRSAFSPEHKCSVFYGAPTKSKLLSTLCSGDVCQCAEGETQGPGAGVGRWHGWGLHSLIWAPDFREVPSTAPGPGAGAAGYGWLQDEVRLLLSPSGLRSVFPPGPRPRP